MVLLQPWYDICECPDETPPELPTNPLPGGKEPVPRHNTGESLQLPPYGVSLEKSGQTSRQENDQNPGVRNKGILWASGLKKPRKATHLD